MSKKLLKVVRNLRKSATNKNSDDPTKRIKCQLKNYRILFSSLELNLGNLLWMVLTQRKKRKVIKGF